MVASASSSLLGSLPIPRTRPIGRELKRAIARSFLLDEAVPLLTLTGPGGVGKTRLALAIASDASASFADGVVWADLAPLDDGALVPTTSRPLWACRRHLDIPGGGPDECAAVAAAVAAVRQL